MKELEITPDKYPDVSYNFIFFVDVALVFFYLFGFMVGVFLYQNARWRPRTILIVGGSIAIAGCYFSSYARSLNTFILLYCCVSSTGYGICTIPHTMCAWEWFPDYKGLVNGVISCGYGFGGLLFLQLSTDLVNPDGKNPDIYNKKNDVTYFDESVSNRVPLMLRELCLVWIWFVLFGIIFVKKKPRA